jgi:hypothetical protein
MRVEVSIVDPSDMEASVAIGWFGINRLEWESVKMALANGVRILFYVFEAYTSMRERIGSFVYTRKAASQGGMLRLLDRYKTVLRQDGASADLEALELISTWVIELGKKWEMVQVTDGGRSKQEKDLAWDFASLIEHRRAGKLGTVLTVLPVPKAQKHANAAKS